MPGTTTPHPADRTWVVVPMLNEEQVIGEVVTGLRRRFAHVVCVDDGSADRSAEVARAAGATVLRHATNLGQGAALQTGISHALTFPTCRWVLTFDADGQHRVDDAVRLVEEGETRDVDVVLGSRFLQPCAIPTGRRRLLKAAVRFTRVTTGLRVTDAHNGLRAFHRRAAADLDIRMSGMAHASELLHHVARAGLRYAEVPVAIDYTAYSLAKGQSGLNALNIAADLLLHRVYATR